VTRHPQRVWLVLAGGLLLAAAAFGQADSEVRKLLAQVGLPPSGDCRGQMDTVGFARSAGPMAQVVARAAELAAPRARELDTQYGFEDRTALLAGVCPHDDYYYASRLYSLLVRHVQAPRVILFGVFHKARVFDVRDRLVFDRFRSWHGPWGPVPVSGLREELLAALPPSDFIVDNDMHQVEHSLEAIVPFLQARRREVEIVPILVPYLDWETAAALSGRCGDALAAILDRHGWRLGRDVAVICSSDAVHYGDSGWGGPGYAPFGTDPGGYLQAVAQDRQLCELYLAGPLRPDKLRELMYRCVDPADVTRYRVTWCGRFAVPLGLAVVERLCRRQGRAVPAGILLDYGTSVSEASLDPEGLEGLGPTAPNNLHHFVGYAAVGFY